MMTIERTLFAALALCACSQQSTSAPAQAAEPLVSAAPTAQWRLPDRLREISGLAVSPDGRLFAHDDEAAVISELDPASGRVIKSFALGRPPVRGDFEGLAITPSGEFWITTSAGEVRRFREGADGANVSFEAFDTGLSDICEVEGLAYLAAEESLILACKENHARGMRDTVSLYVWPFAGSARLWRNLPERALAEAAGVRHFRPSSIDVDPRNGHIVLLSARDGAVAELAPDGEVLSARALTSDHVQAEGVAILANGSLAIADEGGNGHALLSIYPGIAP